MPVHLNQLEAFLVFLEYIAENPAGPYRPAKLARALGYTETRVRRWMALLVEHGILRKLGRQYYQSGVFQSWGDGYAQRILLKGDQA